MENFEYMKAMTYAGGYLAQPEKYYTPLHRLTREEFQFILYEKERFAKEGGSSETPYLHSIFVPNTMPLRRPGGGRKKTAVARPECLDALRDIPVFEQTDSAIPYSTISAREIERQIRESGHPVSFATVESLVESAGWRIHPIVKIPRNHRYRNAGDQFSLANSRILQASARGHDVLFVSAKIISDRFIRCPTDQLQPGRHRFMSAYLQKYLKDNHSGPDADSILLIVEAGGLLGIGNRTLREYLQAFADKSRKTVRLSLLPRGITRMNLTSLHYNHFGMLCGQKSFGEVEVNIYMITAPCSGNFPDDDECEPDSWNDTLSPSEEIRIDFDPNAVTWADFLAEHNIEPRQIDLDSLV